LEVLDEKNKTLESQLEKMELREKQTLVDICFALRQKALSP
jgi:hypothetical protein